jgi:glycosyltransferase involved in cell wall biosynthesis
LKLSIVIPCYNEAGNIPLIVSRFKEILPDDIDCEVLLVNNGSTDNSAEIFKKELATINDPRFKVVGVAKNQGYGFGILTGLASAQGDVMAWTHADMQTDPKDVIRAFEIYVNNNDPLLFVKGKRMSRDFVPLFFTWGMGCVASWALGEKLLDIGAQPKLFSRLFYATHLQKNAPWDFSLDLYAQYWAQAKGKIIEIPVYFNKRLHGEAKGGGSIKTRIKVTRRVFSYILDLRRELKNR